MACCGGKCGCKNETSLRILVCEDDNSRWKYFQSALVGSVVNRASVPREAIDTIKDSMNTYNVIFLDYDYDEDHSGKSGFGTEITKFIVERSSFFKDSNTLFIIHSSNKEGREYMMDDLIEADVQFIMMEPLFWKDPEFNLITVKDWFKDSLEKSESYE